ncbi:MAG: MFS transporter [Spirochaetes bacterium]|nr:MFS transporter [Spirochaetota bacterium]
MGRIIKSTVVYQCLFVKNPLQIKSPVAYNPVVLYNPTVKKQIARISLLQFIFFWSIGSLFPFYSLYYQKVFTSSGGIVNFSILGTILFLQSIVGIASPPIAGLLADKFKIHNRLITFLGVSAVLGAILSSVPGLPFLQNTTLSIKLLFILPGALILGFFSKPIIPLLDTEALRLLTVQYNNTYRYGQVRLFGSIGWILSASLAGFIIAKTGTITSIYMSAILGFTILAIVGSRGIKQEIKPVKIPLKLLGKDKPVQLLFIYVFILSIGMNGSFMFTGVFMNALHVNTQVIGLAFGLAAIPEVFILLSTKKLLPRFGYRTLIIAGVIILSIKLFLFTIIGTKAGPVTFILIQSLHGIAFPLQYAAWVYYLDSRAHTDLKATYQNLNQLVFTLGAAMGTFLASIIIGNLGVRWMMGLSGLTVVISLFFFVIFVK